MEKIKLELSLKDVNLILDALGQLPYIKVHELIGSIQSQGSRQIAASRKKSIDPSMVPESEELSMSPEVSKVS